MSLIAGTQIVVLEIFPGLHALEWSAASCAGQAGLV
jgi:hypothetical protein